MAVSAVMTHILTPDVRLYLGAALLVGGAGGAALASHIHVRWLDRLGCPAVAAHAMVFAALAAGGVALFGPHTLNRGGWAVAAVATGIGVPAGFAVSHLDLWLTRQLARRGAGTGPAARRGGGRPPGNAGRRPPARTAAALTAPRPATTSRLRASTVARDLAGGVNYGTSPAAWTPTTRDTAVPTQLSWLLLAAAAEECVFRGMLTSAADEASWRPGRLFCVAAVVAVFCLSHLYFGWPQVAAKAPLSVLATALTLATGCVAGAVVMHVVVNARVWRSARSPGARTQRSWTQRPWTQRAAGPSRAALVRRPARGAGRTALPEDGL